MALRGIINLIYSSRLLGNYSREEKFNPTRRGNGKEMGGKQGGIGKKVKGKLREELKGYVEGGRGERRGRGMYAVVSTQKILRVK